MNHYLYRTTNLVNGKQYVGIRSHNNPEQDAYLGSGQFLKQAVAKYGVENFKKEILRVDMTALEANRAEREHVDDEFVKRTDTYNMARGGNRPEGLQYEISRTIWCDWLDPELNYISDLDTGMGEEFPLSEIL